MNRLCLLTCLLLVPSTGATAGVPDPAHSTVPSTMAFCPGGDMSPTVIVRDFVGNPVAAATVVVDFGECADERFCAHPFPDPSIGFIPDGQAQKVVGSADAGGSRPLPIAMGGTCSDVSGSSLWVYADGVVLARPPMASPDQNGDYVVDAADEVIIAAKIAAGIDRTADLDGNGTVDNLDLDVFNAHLGHVCDSPTHAKRFRWGELKLLYR